MAEKKIENSHHMDLRIMVYAIFMPPMGGGGDTGFTLPVCPFVLQIELLIARM